MKMVLVALLSAGAGAGGVLAYQRFISPPPIPQVSRAAAELEAQKCRDACEQRMIVEHTSEAQMRTCRAACDGNKIEKPYEPIRSITKAGTPLPK
jgi:hypothetical protein